MLSVTALLLRDRMSKWCRRLFTVEQTQLYAVRILPDREKRKYIAEQYKKLSKEDLVTLEVRAAAYRDRVQSGNAHPLDKVIIRPPRPPRLVSKKKPVRKAKVPAKEDNTAKEKTTPTASSLWEITPYDLFIREQRHNPAIVSMSGQLERELKLMDIYACLPEATRTMLEQRAAEMNSKAKEKREQQRLARAAKSQSGRKGISKHKNARGRTTGRNSSSRRTTQSVSTNKRPASSYALFVQQQMPLLKEIPHKERMKTVAQRWLALGAGERAALTQNSTALPKDAPRRHQSRRM